MYHRCHYLSLTSESLALTDVWGEISGLCESPIRTVGAANGPESGVPVAQEVEGNVAGSSLRLDHTRSCSTGPQKHLSGLFLKFFLNVLHSFITSLFKVPPTGFFFSCEFEARNTFEEQ